MASPYVAILEPPRSIPAETMAKRGSSPPLKKPRWSDVPKDALYTSEGWKALLAGGGTFSYAVDGFQKADSRHSSDQVRAPPSRHHVCSR